MGATRQLTKAQQDRVREILQARVNGSSQEDVGELIGVSQQTISVILKGGGVSLATVNKMGDVGILRVNALLSGDLRGADRAQPAASEISADDVARLETLGRELLSIAARLRG